MWGLLFSTVATSVADSLNPFAITQQFVLQGMVKKPKHIWFFILSSGITNLLGGFLAYFGLVSVIGELFAKYIFQHGRIFFTAELILGIVCLIGVGFLVQNTKIELLKQKVFVLERGAGDWEEEEEQITHKIKSVSPLALVTLGVGATISELTTSLPYFAFLAILFTYQLTMLQVTGILLLYNAFYSLPLILLYFIYTRAPAKFDTLYHLLKTQIAKWADFLAPVLVGVVGVVLIYHSLSLLL